MRLLSTMNLRLLGLVFSSATAHADLRFDRALVPSGTLWWCDDVLCHRRQRVCEDNGTRCRKQDVAYAYIELTSIVGVLPTLGLCELVRKDSATRGEVSPCVAVGVVPPKPYKPLAPGDGFWCFSSTTGGVASSMCHRRFDYCDYNYATSKHSPNTTVQSECLHHKTAWSYMIESDGFREDSMQYLLKEHCVHDAKDAVEPCREVR